MKAYTMSLYTIYTYNPYTILCGVYAIYYLVMYSYCLWERCYTPETPLGFLTSLKWRVPIDFLDNKTILVMDRTVYDSFICNLQQSTPHYVTMCFDKWVYYIFDRTLQIAATQSSS